MSASQTWRRQWLLLALPLVVGAAWLWPELGARGGLLRSEITTKAAVAGIFFLLGLGMPLTALREGMGQWRLHLLVQGWIFLVFPALGTGFVMLMGTIVEIPTELRAGFLYLAVLPTTISTSVVFTAQAHGSTAVTFFNSILANVVGVIVTPLWVAILLSGAGAVQGWGRMLGELAGLLIVPFVLGLIARVWLSSWADARRASFHAISNAGILFIVYATFCDAAKAGTFAKHESKVMLLALAGSAILLGMATFLTQATGQLARLRREDALALMFCGSQKTLAVGVPLAALIFGAEAELGILLLPIMLYHPLQLLLGVWLAARK